MSKQRIIQGHRLVIDADVLRAASDNGEIESMPILCRDTLDGILRSGHTLARSPKIEIEWNKHASGYSLNWLRLMESRRRIQDIEESATGLMGAVCNLSIPPAEQLIMQKDCHLLEAALASDERIISKDEAAYYHFYHASATITQIRKIMWASPMRIKDECAAWLATGAKPEAKRRIGRRPHKNHPDF